MWNKIKSHYDLAMTNFTKSGNYNHSFTASIMKDMLRLQGGEKDGENTSSSESSTNDIDEDPEGAGERGFSHLTRSLPVIYLRLQYQQKQLVKERIYYKNKKQRYCRAGFRAER
jgi:hypothetical protein